MRGETLDLLGNHNVALSLTEGSWIPNEIMFEAAERQTRDFAYLRFMGERDLTRFDVVQREQKANLRLWFELLQEIESNLSVAFVYFSNFYEGFAPASANKFKDMFAQETIAPAELENQPSLF
jgi:uncharacterized protein YecE (DUF72 family)